jgi:peptidoglycan-associated lipoprotein
VTIAGHCDERGTSEYNIALGERRANNVSKYLQTLGVDKNAINTISYGEEQLNKECGEEGPESCHRMNRRAEIQRR